MKKANFIFILLSLMVLSGSVSGCGNSQSVADNSTDTDPSSINITLLNSKGEVEEQINHLAQKYKEETGISVNVLTTTPGVDVQATLKGYYLSDQMPDIIACEASNFLDWDGLLVDLSNQEWTKRTEAFYKDSNSNVIGFPFTTEAIGLTCNKDLLAKAGIDSATLTNPDAYAAAFEKLDSMKDELGIKAVVGYFAEPENLGWSSGNHVFGNYLDSGLARDDTTYIDMLNNDLSIDETRFKNFALFVDMLQQYSDQELLTTGTYDQQVQNFASGQYVFVTQGSWIGASLVGAYADDYAKAGNFEIGMLPYAFEDGIDTILTSSPSWWSIVKEGDVENSKAFIQWCSESSAQKILVEEAGFISPFTDCSYVATDPFAKVVSEYISSNKSSSWHWQGMKEGLGQNHLSFGFAKYASGELDIDGFMDEILSIIRENAD